MLRHREGAQTTIAGIIRDLDLPLPLRGRCESMTWLLAPQTQPIWSRRLHHNMAGALRQRSDTKWFEYDVEVGERLWSLWGGLHPQSVWFDSRVRGRQTVACCMVASCVASLYRNLGEWTPKLLDAIIVNGDRYYRESILTSRSHKQPLTLNDLAVECDFQDIRFMVQHQLVAFGQLYSAPASNTMGLYEALNYFFTRHNLGILVCQQRHLAFGYSSSRNGGYFLFDCGEWGTPLFPDNMGASYVLRAKQLLLLLYCLVVTLNVRQRCVDFQLYAVEAHRVNYVNIQEHSDKELRQ